jgi:hypothetical protein
MRQKTLPLLILAILCLQTGFSQTDIDGIMMQKKFFCIGPTAGYSSWTKYWEGTFKRDNANLGRVSTTNYMLMGNYGITNRLNFLFGVPYIKTKASQGTNAGQKGIQDLSLTVKWAAFKHKLWRGELNSILLGDYTTPLSKYNPDFLPLSIGLHSKNFTFRLMEDYQVGNWTATASAAYVARSNVKLDRYTYYTTEMHYSNEVKMPDAADLNFRLGYRSMTWIAEVTLDRWTTLGGFDIPKNGAPFVSNEMNATKLGLNVKYETPVDGLSIVANGNTTLAGRNVGQSSGFNAGIFYIIDVSGIGKKNKHSKKQKDTKTKK